jgi:hypothetical protein
MSLSWLLFPPSWLLFVGLVIGGASVALFPVAREHEAKVRLANQAKDILRPEIKANEDLASLMQGLLNDGISPLTTFDVAAWQVVSSGGLLVGLEPAQVARLLRVYSLVFRANSTCTRLIELSTANSLTPETKHFLLNVLKGQLTELKKAFTDEDVG